MTAPHSYRRPRSAWFNMVLFTLVLGAATGCVNQPQYSSLEQYYAYDDLYDFGYLACINQTYRQEGRAAIAERLDREIWRFIEAGHYPAKAYGSVMIASRNYASQIPSGDADIACLRWKNGRTLFEVIRLSLR